MERHIKSIHGVKASSYNDRHGGAVIVVVLALMAMLAFLGLFFYDFVQIEANTAENFSGQTDNPLSGVDPDALMNNALSQVLVHPDTDAIGRGSVLDGGKSSLLAHVLGTIKGADQTLPANPPYRPHDYELRNGRGIRVVPGINPGDPPTFIYTGNDANPNPPTSAPGRGTDVPDLILNRSAVANDDGMGNPLRVPDTDFSYEPDVGYTYPDLNSIFLSMEYLQPEDTNGNGMQDAGETDLNGNGAWNANDFVKVVKPSFIDPAVFLALKSNTSQWYNDPTTKKFIFRPHKSHVIPGAGSTPRFLPDQFPKVESTPTALALGPWTGSGKDYGGLDVDADADGVRDSIYIDLGLPPQTLSDGSGRTFIPIPFFKIEDLNGLIDLNSAGNIADIIYKNRTDLAKTAIDPTTPTTVDLVADIFNSGGTTRSIHYSHYGLSRSEINPAWALWDIPPTSMTPDGRTRWDVAFYRTIANPTFTRLQMQNTELAMLLLGSPVSMEQSISSSFSFNDSIDDLQGRYGDPTRIINTTTGNYPAAGQVDIDDDAGEDLNNNGILDTGEDVNGNGVLDGYIAPRGVHPTDSFGTGSIVIDPASRGGRQLTLLGGGQVPMASYEGRWQAQPPTLAGRNYRDLAAMSSPLLPLVGGTAPSVVDLRTDDPGEVNRYSFQSTEFDHLFRPSETAALHLSDFDFTRASMFSRVRQLAPFNFNMSAFSRDIRRQFTTESWDRREFSFAFDPNRSGEFNDIEFTEDPNGDGMPENDQDADGLVDRIVRFPPVLGVAPSRHETGTLSNLDPFRPVVRRLLTTRSIQGDVPAWQTSGLIFRDRSKHPQLPLELNRILDEQTGSTAFDSLGNPNFRQLTPHPNLRLAGTPGTIEPTMVHGNDPTTFPAAPHPVRQYNLWVTTPGDPTALFVQEWWARYDRQRLARDIYVLLGVLCTPSGNFIDAAQAKEMAQFAINYVDEFDEDDCISRFEYDTDLSDGWNPTSSTFVEGVEAQKLSFAEVLWMKNRKHNGMIPATFHRDSTGYHEFLYIELRNGTPFPVDLRENTWRIVRLDPSQVSATMDTTDQTTHIASFAFRSNTKIVEPGANFVIAGHDGNVVNESGVAISSDYYADTNSSPTTLEPVVPATGAAVASSDNPDPLCDLDLCHPNDSMEFTLVPLGDPANAPISATMKTTSNANPKLLYFDADDEETSSTNPELDRMVLSLQRRRNLWAEANVTNAATTPGANDWIEVDRIDFSLNTGNRLTITSNAEVATALPNVRSEERYHHLDDRTNLAILAPAAPAPGSRGYLANHSLYEPYAINAVNAVRRNTVVSETSVPAWDAVYNSVWQPHHDRELTSAYELLTIPVVGPGQLISRLRDHAKNADVAGGVTGWSNSTSFLPYAASVRFAPRFENPQPANVIPWTRLLNFVALPDPTDRVQRKLNANFVRSRTFGQINVNTLRTPPVLAGLIDDPRVIQPNSTGLLEQPALGSREWWSDFKARRDGGIDSRMGGLSSVPFLPPGQFNQDPSRPADAVERGLARHREILNGTNAKFGLFEARSLADVSPTEDLGLVDLHTRNRLLQKIANNSTNRSHLFAIWCGIDFFEGTEVTGNAGKFQVGAKVSDLQTCRWFFIVDMTRLEDAFNTSDNSFDWRKFVIHRQRLE